MATAITKSGQVGVVDPDHSTDPGVDPGPGPDPGPVFGRKLAWRLLRIAVSVHTVAIFGQPAFAGVYLSGDYDALRWHELGADITTTVGCVQLIVAVVVWVRLRRPWPFAATSTLVAAETVQYVAGMRGALWLHLPLGVITIAALTVVFIAVWRRSPSPRARAARDGNRTVTRPAEQGDGNG
ncbi:hypothetical protein [Streptomyces sp. NPDC049813]|uniref:hypothetical protein n=1 Tax=Streptomyces sp. NPDC049813 TaxID=3365597 RepID=UPI0037AA3077